jgi:hypothetical protein
MIVISSIVPASTKGRGVSAWRAWRTWYHGFDIIATLHGQQKAFCGFEQTRTDFGQRCALIRNGASREGRETLHVVLAP